MGTVNVDESESAIPNPESDVSDRSSDDRFARLAGGTHEFGGPGGQGVSEIGLVELLRGGVIQGQQGQIMGHDAAYVGGHRGHDVIQIQPRIDGPGDSLQRVEPAGGFAGATIQFRIDDGNGGVGRQAIEEP